LRNNEKTSKVSRVKCGFIIYLASIFTSLNSVRNGSLLMLLNIGSENVRRSCSFKWERIISLWLCLRWQSYEDGRSRELYGKFDVAFFRSKYCLDIPRQKMSFDNWYISQDFSTVLTQDTSIPKMKNGICWLEWNLVISSIWVLLKPFPFLISVLYYSSLFCATLH
jgi:hypothetical protein